MDMDHVLHCNLIIINTLILLYYIESLLYNAYKEMRNDKIGTSTSVCCIGYLLYITRLHCNNY